MHILSFCKPQSSSMDVVYMFYLISSYVYLSCGQDIVPSADENDFRGYNSSDVLPEIAQHYLKLCPDKQLCTVNGTTRITRAVRSESCCGICDCHETCYTHGNCCPDVLQYFNDSSIDTCVRPQYLNYGTTNLSIPQSYYMTNKCPEEFENVNIRNKCENIPERVRYLEDLWFIQPTSIEKSVYRNRYCAMCHGRQIDHLVPWVISVQCCSSTLTETKSFEELLDILSSNKLCNIFFLPPIIEPSPRSCNWGEYTTCNQTGTMTTYDVTLDRWCGSFTAMFKKQYRNVFCYMCNTEIDPTTCRNEKDITTLFGTSSFTAILDYNFITHVLQRKSQQVTSVEDCTEDQRYDNYKTVCRDISCAAGYVYFEGECKRQYSSENSKSYEMYLDIVPTPDVGFVCVFDIAYFGSQILDELDQLFEEGSHLQSDVCSISLAYTLGRHKCAARFTPISRILAHIEIGGIAKVISSVTEDLEELFAFDGEDLGVDTNNGVTEFSIRIIQENYRNIEFGSNVHQRNYTDPITGEAMLPVPTSSTRGVAQCTSGNPDIIRVSNMLICPRVALTSLEYPARESDDRADVCFDGIDLCVRQGSYEHYGDMCEICADVYFKHVQNMTLKSQDSKQIQCQSISVNVLDSLNLVSLICTSISMLFLLLTVITYSLFRSLRTTPGINNLLLSVNLLVAQGLFQFGTGQIHVGVGCTVIGVLIHYFWLSTIVWMNICSLHMFRVFSTFGILTVLAGQEPKCIKKYVIYSISAPLLPIAANVFVSLASSDWTEIGYGGCLCYISSPNMVLYTFAIPVGVLIVINNVLYIIVVVAIRRSGRVEKYSNHQHFSSKVYVKLSCLTGGSWIFGFLYSWIGHDSLAYIFIILGAGQGLFIFLSFICNKRVLVLYSHGFISIRRMCVTNEDDVPSNQASTIEFNASMSSYSSSADKYLYVGQPQFLNVTAT